MDEPSKGTAKAGPLSVPDPWTLVAEGYSATTRHYLREFSVAGLERLHYGKDSRVVDIACGPGTTALLLSPHVARIACVDFSEGMLAELRRNAEAAGVGNIEMVEADGQALPFADESFDIGVSMFGLMFFPDRTKGFSELSRVLRPGRQALVSSWAPASRSPLMQVVMAALAPEDAAPAEPALPAGLESPMVFAAEMQAAGFVEVEILPVERSVEVGDVESFWRDMVRGSAPVAALRRSLGEADWRAMEEEALRRIEARIGPGPASLASTAWLAVARKP